MDRLLSHCRGDRHSGYRQSRDRAATVFQFRWVLATPSLPQGTVKYGDALIPFGHHR